MEILKRNLRPDVRRELLHFNIERVAVLREFVRKHEILEEEVDKYRSNRNFGPRKVSELETGDGCNNEVEIEEIKEIICWNCSEKGHKFEDCLGERKIFCYGCGSPKIFKPNCSRCNKLSKNFQGPRSPRYLSKATQY